MSTGLAVKLNPKTPVNRVNLFDKYAINLEIVFQEKRYIPPSKITDETLHVDKLTPSHVTREKTFAWF